MTLGRTIEEAVLAALEALSPQRLVLARLPPLPPKRARVRVVAIGKAAPAMAGAALAQWGDRVERALVVTTDSAITDGLARATVLRAAHPLPDDRSVDAATQALALASELTPGDVLLALVSGGASSLLALPPRGSTLDDKRALVQSLLRAGADIRDLNLVRRHASRVKGGRLGRAANGARVLTLYLSDVLGGAAHDVGSGPTVPDPTTLAHAEAALARLGVGFAGALSESSKPGEFPTRALALAEPKDLEQRVVEALRARGLDARRAEAHAAASTAAEVVEHRLRQAGSLAPGEALVESCEPTITLPASPGRGGRAGWIALAAGARLPRTTWLACLASDGLDGSSGGAGAIVCADALSGLRADELDEALTSRDDASVHERLGTQIKSIGPGHNLADVHVLARER